MNDKIDQNANFVLFCSMHYHCKIAQLFWVSFSGRGKLEGTRENSKYKNQTCVASMSQKISTSCPRMVVLIGSVFKSIIASSIWHHISPTRYLDSLPGCKRNVWILEPIRCILNHTNLIFSLNFYFLYIPVIEYWFTLIFSCL